MLRITANHANRREFKSTAKAKKANKFTKRSMALFPGGMAGDWYRIEQEEI
jgi:hypothetical protein